MPKKNVVYLLIGNGEDYSDHNVVGVAEVSREFNLVGELRRYVQNKRDTLQVFSCKPRNVGFSRYAGQSFFRIFHKEMQEHEQKQFTWYSENYWGKGCEMFPAELEDVPEHEISSFVYYFCFEDFINFCLSTGKMKSYSTSFSEWQ